MPKKITTYILFFSFLHLVGCYSFETTTYSEFEEVTKTEDAPKDIFIITFDSTKYHFRQEMFTLEGDSININGTIVLNNKEEPFTGKIAKENIKSIELKNFSTGKTIIFVSSIAVGVTLFVLLISSKENSGSSSGSGCSGGDFNWKTYPDY